ncbi:Ribosome biogenesis protein BMS1/TSR1, C-terminal [Sesbania bispinosa]|nr:Ribosome biogenesis protein BMS1/TSR1, C-terminal [Sesbania bispinosa]
MVGGFGIKEKWGIRGMGEEGVWGKGEGEKKGWGRSDSGGNGGASSSPFHHHSLFTDLPPPRLRRRLALLLLGRHPTSLLCECHKPWPLCRYQKGGESELKATRAVRPPWVGREFKSISLTSPASLLSLLAIFIKHPSKIELQVQNQSAMSAKELVQLESREIKWAAILKEKRELSGSRSPPRVIVLFALSASVDLGSLADDLLSLLCKDSSAVLSGTVASPEYKTRITVLKAPHGDLLSCMEMAKVADLLVFVASARSLCEETDSYYIDSFGNQCLSVFRSLGLPSTSVFLRDLPTELKQRNELKKMCSSSLASEFPEDCKFFPADTEDDLHKSKGFKVPHWRTQRSYLMAHKVDAVHNGNSENCTLILTGYLRAHSLSVNQLVHVSGAGDFQLCKIEVLKDPFPLNPRKNQDLMDSDEMHDDEVIGSLVPDPQNQEALVVENIPDPLAGEQTWPTEAEITKANEDQKQKKIRKRRLPQGTSEYQAAWIVDDSEEELDSDNEDDDVIVVIFACKEADNMTREKIQDELKELKEAHAADEEFPDEVDTPLDVPARKRFAKYRGLKSFRTSSWDPKNWSKKTGRTAFQLAHIARLHIMEVPSALASKLIILAKTLPVTACGLLKHESKIPSFISDVMKSLVFCSVKKHETYDAPIKSKEELIFHVGFRQFVGRPVFSSEFINTDKNKMERFLHAGRFSVASIYAPISFPPLPTIILKRDGEDAVHAVAAVGSLKTVDPDRIILKRVILTGYPQRVSKRKASVKHMFYNPEDVKWLRALYQRGLRGRIKEPVGTHGAMKCLLNGVLEQSDTICMNLYKRAYPKWPNHRFPLLEF